MVNKHFVWLMVVVGLLSPFVVSAASMAEQNMKLVQKGYEYFGQGDMEGVLSLTSEDWIQVMPGSPEAVPWAGTFEGHEGFMKFGMLLMENAEILNSVHKEYIAQRDKVVVLFHETLRIKSTGRSVEFDAVAVWTVKDGKLISLNIYEDTYPIAEAFK